MRRYHRIFLIGVVGLGLGGVSSQSHAQYQRDYYPPEYRIPRAPDYGRREYEPRRWEYRGYRPAPPSFSEDYYDWRRDDDHRGDYDRRRIAWLAEHQYNRVKELAREVDFHRERSPHLERLHQVFRRVGRSAVEVREAARRGGPDLVAVEQRRFSNSWDELMRLLPRLDWAVEGEWRGLARDIARTEARLDEALGSGDRWGRRDGG